MTRHLVIGAGASFAECKAANVAEELCLPLIGSFARKLWKEFNPAFVLRAYLQENGIDVPDGADVRDIFFNLELTRSTEFNIELFIAYLWSKREQFPGEWEKLAYHGIQIPMVLMLSQGLWKHQGSIVEAPLKLSPKVAQKLNGGDLVLDLNYDTLFEIGATQAGKSIVFLPNTSSLADIRIAKPHGSFNLIVNSEKRSFAFGKLEWPGTPQPADGSRNYLGFVPPRLNKNFIDHPVAHMIVETMRHLRPRSLTFWGVGFTTSDADLTKLYRDWSATASTIEVINPDKTIATKLERAFGKPVIHYPDLEDWLKS
jgi:hypothetical protein